MGLLHIRTLHRSRLERSGKILHRAREMKPKKRKLGGVEYIVLGATIERIGLQVVKKSYTTTKGTVLVEKGNVRHPDGTVTRED